MTRRNRSGSAGSGDLFARAAESAIAEGAPLAARMRPRTLDEYVGQDAIVGRGRLLRRAIEADRLGSLIFYGPPGTGKTTLAQVIAGTTEAEFTALNAVLSGVKDIREAVARARSVRGEQGRRTILFIDEVHRFNKAQQDALLPWVENGTVILIGATTENPYFEVNAALVSRSRIFRLEPLTEDDLRAVADAALNDRDRGYGDFDVTIDADALDHLVDVANGDARALLNALELAVETTPPGSGGDVRVTLSVAEESIQQRAVFYDREGDAHFDAISAFIKACRGSDADAALYWLARMIHAGEDPRYLFRRLIILAGEDVGLADPDCIVRVEACAKAFDRIGLPEGRYPLAQATLLVATAPKSNSTMGFFEALATVKRERTEDVPDHLKDGTRDKEGFGHGEGYLYPHAYRDHWVAQQYLPAGLQGQVYYQPSDQGWEAGIRETVVRRREAQLAALELESSEPRGLTTGPEGAEIDRWTRRAMAGAGAEMGAIRDAVIDAADLQRHHVVCEARARTGLLTWEALRRCPEGSAWAWVTDPPPAGPRFADALREQVAALDALVRPVVFVGGVERAGPALEIGALRSGDRARRVRRAHRRCRGVGQRGPGSAHRARSDRRRRGRAARGAAAEHARADRRPRRRPRRRMARRRRRDLSRRRRPRRVDARRPRRSVRGGRIHHRRADPAHRTHAAGERRAADPVVGRRGRSPGLRRAAGRPHERRRRAPGAPVVRRERGPPRRPLDDDPRARHRPGWSALTPGWATSPPVPKSGCRFRGAERRCRAGIRRPRARCAAVVGTNGRPDATTGCGGSDRARGGLLGLGWYGPGGGLRRRRERRRRG